MLLAYFAIHREAFPPTFSIFKKMIHKYVYSVIFNTKCKSLFSMFFAAKNSDCIQLFLYIEETPKKYNETLFTTNVNMHNLFAHIKLC